jgi:hypothetical protein
MNPVSPLWTKGYKIDIFFCILNNSLTNFFDGFHYSLK